MGEAIGRLLAFCLKEVKEVTQQPLLVLSLLLGPSLILFLFGLGYQSERPIISALLVVPANPPAHYPIDGITRAATASFNLVGVVHNREEALALLGSGKVMVVEAWPDTLDRLIVSGQKTPVEFFSNEVNPLNTQWIQYLAYAQINEINKALLTDLADRSKSEINDLQAFLKEAREQVQVLRTGIDIVKQDQQLERLEHTTDTLQTNAELIGPDARGELVQLQADLRGLREAQQRGRLAEEQQRLDRVAEQLDRLEQVSGQLKSVPSDVLVSPLSHQYHSLASIDLDPMKFYAPAVLALLIQHVAVALGALALVRERQLGSMELFRVAPVKPIQMLVGKYLGYLLFILTMVVALTLVIVYGLGVPFLGSVWRFALEVLLLVLASLGVGFTISAIATTDSQAVQLSMLVLLLSIFFSGFFLSLDSFVPAIRDMSQAIPLTHGITAFQSELFNGRLRDANSLLWLSIIAVITFNTAWFFTVRQFRRI
jgi:ABC-2 type transport system permease protein